MHFSCSSIARHMNGKRYPSRRPGASNKYVGINIYLALAREGTFIVNKLLRVSV